MGLKHGKYVYVKRADGYYVKVRVLNVRFRKKMKEEIDTSNPSLYIPTGHKTRSPPTTTVIIEEEALPTEVRNIIKSL